MASYKDLIHHPSKDIRNRWDKARMNAFARLLHGYGDVEGMNVFEWIQKHQVPKNKKATHPRYTVAIQSEKDKLI